MIFARYMKGIGPGEFTHGKTYLATPSGGDVDSVDLEWLYVTDDEGERVQIDGKSGRFEYVKEVFAVVLKAFDEFTPGDIVIVDNASVNGKTFYYVQGLGYIHSEALEILDQSNVTPGIKIRHTTGYWLEVEKVDECVWVQVAGEANMKSLTEFRFAVSDGDLLTEPIVRCIDADGLDSLKEGSLYKVVSSSDDGWMVVNTERTGNIQVESTRFEFL